MQSVTGNETYGGTVEDFVNIVVTYKNNTTVGINNVSTDKASAAVRIYDLQGRRVQRVQQPGLYIVNGKKTLVK